MIAKIQNFFLIRRVFEQRKNINSKKLSTLLSIIENTLENIDLKDKVNDLFLLSSYFNPYLNIPNFLFKKIIENKSYILINKDNKKLIAQFVNDLLIKIKPNYTLFSFANSLEVDFADKITSETIQIFAILLKKFKELNLLSLNLLSINILNSEKILSQCFDNSLERKGSFNLLSFKLISCSIS